MAEYILTIVDTTGIQKYVFGTNNLQQISGASYLVNCATREWVKDALKGFKHNQIDFSDVGQPFGDEKIEDPQAQLDAELIYAGGGNTVLLFSSMDHAVEFTRALTRKILVDAPGLNAVVVHQPFTWETEVLGGKGGLYRKTMQCMAAEKSRRAAGMPVLGRAVTAECVFTSLPAVGTDQDNRLVSAESDAKRRQTGEAFNGLLGTVDMRWFEPPTRELDELGMTHGEKSLLAVVHIDGNGMGKRIEAVGEPFITAGPANRDFLQELRKFSVSVQKAARDALQEVIDLLFARIDQSTGKIGEEVLVWDDRMPFRPIILGGDDVTLVCDGRLGLGLAVEYLKSLNKQVLSDKENLSCRAGVAIVKAHYPFSRAYDLAEKLCASAKQQIAEVREELENKKVSVKQLQISAIDWHIATSGLALSLDETRDREYRVKAGWLNARPVTLAIKQPASAPALPDYKGNWRTWANISLAIREFDQGEAWAGMHNKVKALRQALRGGPSEVEHFAALYNAKWPRFDHVRTSEANDGFALDRCLYYDAVEAADLYISLDQEEPK